MSLGMIQDDRCITCRMPGLDSMEMENSFLHNQFTLRIISMQNYNTLLAFYVYQCI